ncbi:hypothetical protein NDU88_004865 [Pleurodeles waltl]|uniref:Uncharacterized protein n=1 Tax=Pleurodeles waltl TaxID=8319 RepID=A0AAV7VHG1_PLEWA|nr:hypothetical protein NDU88_004865 [Pleurodeles waltl]
MSTHAAPREQPKVKSKWTRTKDRTAFLSGVNTQAPPPKRHPVPFSPNHSPPKVEYRRRGLLRFTAPFLPDVTARCLLANPVR